MQFAVENQAHVMSYFDHYVPPELIEIVVDQTNLYAQQQIAKMPSPVTKKCTKSRMEKSNSNQNEKIPWFDFCN